jgi:hypothetical protein
VHRRQPSPAQPRETPALLPSLSSVPNLLPLFSDSRHPPFLHIMDEIQQGLRYLFQTDSKYTLVVSGTGHAGMEAVIANLIAPGETIVVANSGIWGERVCDMAERFGAKVSEQGGSLAPQQKLENCWRSTPSALGSTTNAACGKRGRHTSPSGLYALRPELCTPGCHRWSAPMPSQAAA